MPPAIASRRLGVATVALLVGLGVINAGAVGAAAAWVTNVSAGSHGSARAQGAITSATGNPALFNASCAASGEKATLDWSSAGSGVTGYEVLVSSNLAGPFSLDATQPSGAALTVTERYTAGASGQKFYRLEAKSENWNFPGTDVTNAREVAVVGIDGGYLVMSGTGTRCVATP